jgi:methionyl-tRNA synthetase
MDRWRTEPRAVTRDLDWGIDSCGWSRRKNYMFGLMRLSDIFPLPEWAAREGKEWEPY